MSKMNCLFEFGNEKIYDDLGGSPKLLTDLCQWLQRQKHNIVSVDMALYLFNNAYLFSVLKELADSGCRVCVYSIPLEGYDAASSMEIRSHLSGDPIGRHTKYDLAEKLYEKIRNLNHPNLSLRIVPHMYIRSRYVKPFSRGDMPYSLHCKTFLIQLRGGRFCAGLTSSNFAVRDAQKIELACIMPLGEAEIASSTDFYSGLFENSVPVEHFDPTADYAHWKIRLRSAPKSSQTMYIAPFYENSPEQFEHQLIELIRRTKRRIVIAAQHLCAYEYTSFASSCGTAYPVRREGFLTHVLRKAQEGVPAVFLSQTYADGTDRPNVRRPQNIQSFIRFAHAAKKTGNCSYYVNRSLHAKYLIADDTVIVMTCNLTPSQFLYLPDVTISSFAHMPNMTYSGIFCEHGAYFISHNPETVSRLEEETRRILSLPGTQNMFGA